MADLIQNMQDVYKKWESRSNPSRGRLKSSQPNRYSGRKQYHVTDTLSNFSRSLQQRHFKRGPHLNVHKYDSLAQFKMAPSDVTLHKPRPFVGIPCARCFPHSKALIDDETVYLLGVNNILLMPYFSLQSLNVNKLWNLFKTRSSFPQSLSDFIQSRRIEDTIQEILSSENPDEGVSTMITLDKLHENVKATLKHLKSSISSFCLEISSFILHNILKKIFNGIFVHKGQMEILKILSKEDIPFLYLPLHRSYFDYILVSYVLHMNSLEAPFIVVADDLFVPILGSLFRFLGAIFIQRHQASNSMSKEILYEAVVKSYIVKCLQMGNDMELLLEAYPSLTGKPTMPNSRLLSSVVESISEGSLEDAFIVPVSIIYEIVEGSYVSEQLRSNPNVETTIFSKFYYYWRMMHLKNGNVRLNFNQPLSIKEFLETSKKQSQMLYRCPISVSPDLSSGGCTNNSTSHTESSVSDLAVHVFHDATVSTSLMCTHLLAFLLITQFRKGGTQQQLQNSMDWLRSEIYKKKCDVGFTGESLPAIERAVKLLGKELISVETVEMEWTSSDFENNNVKVKIFTPVVKLPHVLELQYYANGVVPIFLKQSILVNALYALVDVDICHFHHCDSMFYVSRDALIQRAVKLARYLKYEFITVLPCQDIVSVFNDAVDELIEKECLSTANIASTILKSSKKSRALSFDVESDEDEFDEAVEQQLKIDLKEESISHLEFLRSVLSPYIESYWLAACSLLQLIDEVKEESVFIQEMQMTAKEKLYKGLLAYEESFSAETFKNTLMMFTDLHIIECDYEDKVKTVCLSEAFNSFEMINDVIAEIEDFRK